MPDSLENFNSFILEPFLTTVDGKYFSATATVLFRIITYSDERYTKFFGFFETRNELEEIQEVLKNIQLFRSREKKETFRKINQPIKKMNYRRKPILSLQKIRTLSTSI